MSAGIGVGIFGVNSQNPGIGGIFRGPSTSLRMTGFEVELVKWRVVALVVCAAVVGTAFAQTPKLEFDVASVKENKSGDQPHANFPLGPGAMYNPNGGVFSATSMPMWIYIMF